MSATHSCWQGNREPKVIREPYRPPQALALHRFCEGPSSVANRSFETGQPVLIKELVKGLHDPDYPPMPSRTGPLPMPGKQEWKP